jgi:2-amino-4-hydroxy-6-hydroxymethyldihydropteridine diphosphokinase
MARAIACIGLGANLGGDPARLRATLISAWRALQSLAGSEILATSSLWRSAPVDASGPDYLNAVVVLQTDLAPLSLLHALQAIESSHGRQRPYRNAPRTLDLDLLRYGDTEMDTPELILPHPRLRERAFVLRPLLEVAPERAEWVACLPAVADQALERLPQDADWPPS